MRIKLENVKKSFGKFQALKGITLEFEERSFVVILGPSGCGKTTMLRILAGLDKPTEGKVLFNDEEVTNIGPKERNIAMVFQDYALYPHMTAYENIALNLKVAGVPKHEIEKRVMHVAEILSLRPYLKKRPPQLSGGQQQRVALGRAIVREPRVFLMDEPLSNLDAALRIEMRSELKALHKRVKATTIYVTHDQSEAMTLADKVVVMNHGVVEQVGTPREIYDKPTNLFVAKFVGHPPINLLEGEIVDGRFEGEGASMEISPQLSGKRKVVLGIRAEAIRIVPPDDRTAMCRGKVGFYEYLGNVGYLMVKLANTSILVETPVDKVPEEGSIIGLSFNLKHIHLFDENGARIEI